ncbi:MAG: UBA domain-containing protein [Armatimonadota bacterium]
MNNELEKIDIIRSRFKVTYDEARDALNAASGDLIHALAIIEKGESTGTDLLSIGAEIVDEVQNIISSGSIKKLRVKYGNRVLTEKPVVLKAAAAVAVAIAAILITKLVIEVDKDEEEVAREVP